MVDPCNLTVLIPGFECRPFLEKQSESLAILRKRGAKILWVITPSSDSTELKAREICTDTGDELHLAPKGLYQSWNYGITKTKTEFVYFSTINDFTIGDEVLRMCDALQFANADLCFSPPNPHNPDGSINKHVLSWPVHLHKSFLKGWCSNPFPTTTLIALQVNSGLSCLLGSWASVVSRTSFLRSKPFPTSFGHHSDTLWFYQNLLDVQLIYYPKPVAHFAPWSTFKKKEFSDIQLNYQYRQAVVRLFHRARKRNIWLKRSFDRFRKYYAIFYILNKNRGAHPKRFWWLKIRLWILRFKRGIAAFRLASWHKHWKALEPRDLRPKH